MFRCWENCKWLATDQGTRLCNVQSWNRSSGHPHWPRRQEAHWVQGYTSARSFSHWLPPAHECRWPSSLVPLSMEAMTIQKCVSEHIKKCKCFNCFNCFVECYLFTFAGYSPWKFPPEMVSPLSANTIWNSSDKKTETKKENWRSAVNQWAGASCHGLAWVRPKPDSNSVPVTLYSAVGI